MRGKRAKELRKQLKGRKVYGETEEGQRVCLGARASYLKAKDEYKKDKR